MMSIYYLSLSERQNDDLYIPYLEMSFVICLNNLVQKSNNNNNKRKKQNKKQNKIKTKRDILKDK